MVEKAKKAANNPEAEAPVQETAGQETAGQAENPGQTEAIFQEQAAPQAPDYKLLIEDLNDKALRALAEAQNTRRRADIDIQNAKNYAIQSFAKDLLGVMDNLFRACDTISTEDAVADPKLNSVKEGIEITKREMINVLERFSVKRIEPTGEAFDPNLHQAISQVVDATTAPNTVIQVLQPGYILKDRLLRPALVITTKSE